MCAKAVDELLVYQKALAAANAISALLERECFRRDLRLRDQLGPSSTRVVSDIAEGFGQKADRHFAQYLYDANGSSGEVRAQLAVSLGRRYISSEELATMGGLYEEINRMLTGLIKYLHREDRKIRY